MLVFMQGIQKLEFDSLSFAEEDALAAWGHFFSKLSHTTPLRIPGKPFLANATVWLAERVSFTVAHSQLQTYECEESSGFKGDKRDLLLAWTCKSGIGQYVHDGKIVGIRPGDLFLLDLSREVRALMTEAEMYSIAVPHQAVGYERGKHPSHALFRTGTPEARAFGTFVEEMFVALPRSARMEAPLIAAKASAFLQATLAQSSTGAVKTDTLGGRIREYVDENIFDPTLNADHLMSVFEISRGRLYEVTTFARDLERYIAERRLEYALRSLTFGPKEYVRTADLAQLCSYSDPADFEEAFSKEFGFSPELVSGILSHAKLRPEEKRSPKLWDTWHGARLC